MANALSTDLTDKIVRLRADAHAPEWREPKHLLFKVEGGFGASAFTAGTALVGTYLCDGEQARLSGSDVEAIVDPQDPLVLSLQNRA